MRVTLLTRRLERTGGAEQQLAKLAIGLQARGDSVRVLTFYPGDSLDQEVRQLGVRVEAIGKRGRWDIAWFFARLRHALRRDPPDVLQTFLVPANVLGALALIPRNRTRLVWGVRASNMDLGRYDWTHRVLEGLETTLAGRADLVIANSVAAQTLLRQRGFLAGRIAVVPNGIDTERFHPDCPAAADVRAACLDGVSGPLIGIVARLDPMKDYATFLSAARLLVQDMPGARFACVGTASTPHGHEILRRCDDLGLGPYVRWLGQRTDVFNVINACDVMTLSSAFGEGFPNVLGEAMACGVPVVSTDVGDAAQIVGDCGRIVPVRDPARLAGAWRELCSLRRRDAEAIGLAARRRVVENFSVAHMLDRTQALYAQVCAGTPSFDP